MKRVVSSNYRCFSFGNFKVKKPKTLTDETTLWENLKEGFMLLPPQTIKEKEMASYKITNEGKKKWLKSTT